MQKRCAGTAKRVSKTMHRDSTMLMYGKGIGTQQNKVEASRWFRKAADQGHSWAQSWLEDMYRDGIGVPQNYVEAARWYRKATEQGDASAQPGKSLSRVLS